MNTHDAAKPPPNALAASHHVWSVDVIAHCADAGRKHAILVVINDDTGECLDLYVDKAISSEAVIDALDRLVAERGAPAQIRCDHGRESSNRKIETWLTEHGIAMLRIRPDSPRYRAQIEAFCSTLRREVLDETRSGSSLQQIRDALELWNATHNGRVRNGANF